MKVLIATDVFPPHCGGSGWSAFYLAQALAERGHDVRVVLPVAGQRGVIQSAYEGLPVTRFGYPCVNLPLVRGWLRRSVLGTSLAGFIEAEVHREGIDLVHAQHLLTVPPAVEAGERIGVPIVATVRDYWPVCFFGTMESGGQPCNGCVSGDFEPCLRRRYGLLLPLTQLFVPVMRGELRQRQRALAKARAIIAVSSYVKSTLAGVADERVTVVPNLIDLVQAREVAAQPPTVPPPNDYLLFVGKLATNKGALLVLDVARQVHAETRVVGDGPLRAEMEAAALRDGLPVRFLGWLSNDEVLRAMARAKMLLFPSLWAEPLARTLIEAAAVGLPAVAMDTGGSRDIVIDGETGFLVCDVAGMVEATRRLLADEPLRQMMARRARQIAEERFSKTVVVERVEQVYRAAMSSR
jgi:glycosyltransferase involved in cell wall biosynthesis